MTSQRNPKAVQKLAALVRELCASPDYAHIAHYAALIAALQDARDEVAKFPKGSPENARLWGLATKVYNAARNYAAKYKLEAPNEVMRASGYQV
jgi:hypothetical protein